jgi:hypothetical protein
MPLFGLPTILPENVASTGIISGGALTINANPALFDVSAGVGYIADQTTTPTTFKIVTWGAFTARAVTNISTQSATDIAINASGQIVQQLSFSNTELRSLIFLGGLDHSGGTQINNTFAIQVPANGIGSSLSELARAIGDLNNTGNIFLANGANLRINKTAGTTFSYGRNNLANAQDPHTLTQIAQEPVTFTYVYSNGAGGSTFVGGRTDINPNQYDNGTGSLASLTGAQWSIQRILMFSNTGNVFVQYGTETFTRKADAIAGLATTTFENLPGIRTALVRGFLIVQRNATALNGNDAQFIDANRFGSFVPGSGGAAPVEWGDITGTLSTQTDLQSAIDDAQEFIRGTWSPVVNIQLLRLTENDGGAITGDGLIFTGSGGALATSGAGSLNQVELISGYYFGIDTSLYTEGELSRIGFGDADTVAALDYAIYVKIEKPAIASNILVSLEFLDLSSGIPVTTGTTPITVTNVADLAVGISTQGGNSSVHFYHPTDTAGPTITYTVPQQITIDRLFVRHEGAANAVLTITEEPEVIYTGITQGMNESQFPTNPANKAYQADIEAPISTPVGTLNPNDIATFGNAGQLLRIISQPVATPAITVQSGTNANGDWMIGYDADDNVLWRWFKVVANSSASGNVTVNTPVTMGSFITFGFDENATAIVLYQSTQSGNTTSQFSFNMVRVDTGARTARTAVIYGFEFVVAT